MYPIFTLKDKLLLVQDVFLKINKCDASSTTWHHLANLPSGGYFALTTLFTSDTTRLLS